MKLILFKPNYYKNIDFRIKFRLPNCWLNKILYLYQNSFKYCVTSLVSYDKTLFEKRFYYEIILFIRDIFISRISYHNYMNHVYETQIVAYETLITYDGF